MKTSVLIGITSYNDLTLLKESLPALEILRKELSASVVLLDNAWDDETKAFAEKEYPDFQYIRHPEGNIGYGKSYNEILRENPGHEFFLVVTSDVILDPSVVAEFVKRMKEDSTIAQCAGKLYSWDLELHRKTRRIDSFGIMAEKRHHFFDRGHGEEDHGQYDDSLNDIFGLTGAVFLIRTDCAPAAPSRIFDDRMWMYKEDIDLAYRLRWMGKGIRLFPEVWGWHARSVANKGGKSVAALARADSGKRQYGREHSYKNHILLLKNNFSWRFGAVSIVGLLFYEFLKAGFMLFRHPGILISGLKTLLFVPARRSPRQESIQRMRSFFI